MSRVLHLLGIPDTIHAGFAALIDNLNAGERSTRDRLHDAIKEGIPYQLFVANSLWCQQGYPFQDDFLKIAGDRYGAGLNQVDFGKNAESARQQINAWVARRTQNKIQDLVPQGKIDDFTQLVLADAIYFKGHWHVEFDKSKTQDAPFHVNSSRSTSVATMNVEDEFNYGETENLQMVELPYFAQRMSLIILLPKQVDGLSKLEQSLDPPSFNQLLGQMQSHQVNVFLPKFKLTSEFNLGDTLQAMGMTEAFSPQADFSGISTSSSLYIGFVLHKAYVNVDEEGTEAAAATAIGMMMGIMRPPPPPIVFRADHPFLLLIRHNQTGTILFMGRLTSP
jgi:serpin B